MGGGGWCELDRQRRVVRGRDVAELPGSRRQGVGVCVGPWGGYAVDKLAKRESQRVAKRRLVRVASSNVITNKRHRPSWFGVAWM